MTSRTLRRIAPPLAVAALLGFLLWRTGKLDRPAGAGTGELLNDSRFAMGTYVQLTLRGEDRGALSSAAGEAWSLMQRLERDFTPWNAAGALGRLNAAAADEEVPLRPDLDRVLALSFDINRRSGGAFNPALGGIIRLWGFEGMSDPHLPPAAEIADALRHTDPGAIVVDRARGAVARRDGRLAIDLGAVAKGYIVDRMAELLASRGITHFIVNAGGDLVARGDRGGEPWRIGIQDPEDPQGLVLKLAARDSAVVTSGDYERFFEAGGVRYHHIMDPTTGYPARGCRSVTVLAKECALADALSTAVFVLGPEKGIAFAATFPGVQALVIDGTGGWHATPGFAARITWSSKKI